MNWAGGLWITKAIEFDPHLYYSHLPSGTFLLHLVHDTRFRHGRPGTTSNIYTYLSKIKKHGTCFAEGGESMPANVTLDVTDGPIKGKKFVFKEHDTFIFGRDEDCHARLAEDDVTASRHHFILEVNPPDVRIRDLGSLNGTFVNETKYGGRKAGETPEEAANRQYPEVDIVNEDQIRVGKTIFSVAIHIPAVCNRCNVVVPDAAKSTARKDAAGNYTCRKCVEKEKQAARPLPPPPPAVRCSQCGKDASKEAGPGRRGDYVCESCRNKAAANPLQALLKVFADKLRDVGGQAKEEFPGYKVIKMLGQGGMGAVYLATRNKDGANVAIKVMLAKVAVSDSAKKGFQREIDVTMKLNHPNIVTCYEQGSAGSGFYFVLEFCEGGSVDGLMEALGGKLPVDIAGPIMLQSLEGLAYAHDKKYVHRDLKPQNLLLTAKKGGTAKVADLGLAKNFQQAGFSGMTVTGGMAGTPVFMPKEQLTNFKYVKPVTDVWSMGATFYCMLTGMLPRDMQRGQSPLEAILKGHVVPIRDRNRSLPTQLAGVIDKSLSDRPQDRYEDAGAFLKALKKVL